MILGLAQQIFEKHPNIIFHKNMSSGSRVVPCGQTDRHGTAESRFSQFYESAYKVLTERLILVTTDIGVTVKQALIASKILVYIPSSPLYMFTSLYFTPVNT
jgi:hypothetical protein